MKTTTKNILKLGALLIIIHILPTSCNKDNEVKQQQLNSELINNSECKRNKSTVPDEIANNQSGIQYSYDESTKTLSIKHINAGFNCSIDGIGCKVDIDNGTLILEEYQSGMAASCNCIYDIDIEVKDLEKRSYTVKVIEPLIDNENEISFVIDLNTASTGEYFVTREYYPWGE